jgi:subtilase family serine protease
LRHRLKTRARRVLLASAAVVGAASAHAAPAPIQDLGAVEADTPIAATVWLAPANKAAFDAAVASRMTPGSAEYHHWMTAGDLAAFAPPPARLAELVQALKAAGLNVAPRGDATNALRITGPAAAMQTAFATHLHMVRNGAVTYRSVTTDPHFSGPGAGLIAGITGLTNAPMRPYIMHQRDLYTGKPVELAVPTASAAHPDIAPPLPFRHFCFEKGQTVTLNLYKPHGGTQHVTVTGPQNIAAGYQPSKYRCGFAAADVAAHYGIDAAYKAGYHGEGQTIVLVDAYGAPTIARDANVFATMNNLPAFTSKNFKAIYSDSKPIANPFLTDWPIEISLDVEWAHALAPNANIVLVVAASDDADDLAYAVNYAVTHKLGTVISNSYGYPEHYFGPAVASAFNTVIEQAAAQGIAVNVSTGDSGDLGLGTPVGAASIPADSPFATGIGGTSVNVPSDNGYVESSWGNTETYLGDIQGVPVPPGFVGFTGGGGGGESVYLPKPAWQSALPGTGRQLPDIAAIADPNTGAIVVGPSANAKTSVVEIVGGTSLSSPVFSGIWALANQAAGKSLGQAGPIIAKLKGNALRDIVPIVALTNTLSGSDGIGSQSISYTPAELLNIQNTQPTGFVGTAVQITSGDIGILALFDIGYGTDTSLMAAPGWDNATGYGVPNGLVFIKDAAWAK